MSVSMARMAVYAGEGGCKMSFMSDLAEWWLDEYYMDREADLALLEARGEDEADDYDDEAAYDDYEGEVAYAY